MFRRLIPAVLVALVLTLAGAGAAHARTCADATSGGARAIVTTTGPTSCALGKATARRVARLGYAPSSLRVASPVTGLSYRLWRTRLESPGDDYFSVSYAGPNGIRIRITAFTI
jgi:hypothetical protein